MISLNAVQEIATTSGKEPTEEDEIWKHLSEYCTVAERLAVLRTLQVERKLLASHTHIDTLRKALDGHQHAAAVATFQLTILRKDLARQQVLQQRRWKLTNMLFRTARRIRRLHATIQDTESQQEVRSREMARFEHETYLLDIRMKQTQHQASEYARLVVREQELLRALSPLLSGDPAALGPLREARRLRQQKLKAATRLEQARSAAQLLQEAGRLLRHVRRTLEWARPRLSWVKGMHGASVRRFGVGNDGPHASPLTIPPPEVLAAMAAQDPAASHNPPPEWASTPSKGPPSDGPSTSISLAPFDQPPSLASTPPAHNDSITAATTNTLDVMGGPQWEEGSPAESGGTVRLHPSHASSSSAAGSPLQPCSDAWASEHASGQGLVTAPASPQGGPVKGAPPGGASPMHSARSSVGSGQGPPHEEGGLEGVLQGTSPLEMLFLRGVQDSGEEILHTKETSGFQEGPVVPQEGPGSLQAPLPNGVLDDGPGQSTSTAAVLLKENNTHQRKAKTLPPPTTKSQNEAETMRSQGNNNDGDDAAQHAQHPQKVPARRSWLTGWWSQSAPPVLHTDDATPNGSPAPNPRALAPVQPSSVELVATEGQAPDTTFHDNVDGDAVRVDSQEQRLPHTTVDAVSGSGPGPKRGRWSTTPLGRRHRPHQQPFASEQPASPAAGSSSSTPAVAKPAGRAPVDLAAPVAAEPTSTAARQALTSNDATANTVLFIKSPAANNEANFSASSRFGAAQDASRCTDGGADRAAPQGHPRELTSQQQQDKHAQVLVPSAPSSPFVDADEAVLQAVSVGAGRGAGLQHAQRSSRALTGSVRGTDPFGMAQACLQLLTRLEAAHQKTMSAAGLVVKAKELLPTKPPVALERADALLPGLWGEEGPLDIRHLEDTRLYEALQHVNTLRHEVDVVLVWLEQMEVGLEDKQASLQAQQDAKQADAQDRQRVLLGDVLAAVMGEMEGRHS